MSKNGNGLGRKGGYQPKLSSTPIPTPSSTGASVNTPKPSSKPSTKRAG